MPPPLQTCTPLCHPIPHVSQRLTTTIVSPSVHFRSFLCASAHSPTPPLPLSTSTSFPIPLLQQPIYPPSLSGVDPLHSRRLALSSPTIYSPTILLCSQLSISSIPSLRMAPLCHWAQLILGIFAPIERHWGILRLRRLLDPSSKSDPFLGVVGSNEVVDNPRLRSHSPSFTFPRATAPV